MRSIRTQLVIWLVGGILALTMAAGLGLYSYMDEVLERGLDAALAAKAEAIAKSVHLDDGQPRLQLADVDAIAAPHREGPFYFQIWRADGSTLARSAPAAMKELPFPRLTNPKKRFADVTLGDGSDARITELSFVPRDEDDDADSLQKKPSQASGRLVLLVAHDRRSIDGTLGILLSGLVAGAVVVSAGIVLIITWGVRRGLGPLLTISAMVDRIGPDSLDIRFPGGDQLPAELIPIGLKLNELLDRLAAAFARERRFSAAAAHELRTPLAELRSTCEVALRWPDNAEGLSVALTEARDVAIEMSAMVHALLSLARQQAGTESPRPREMVQLSAAVSDAWPGFTAAAARRALSIEQNLDETAVVQTDPALLKAVLRSLLENAVCHAPAGGQISLRTARSQNNQWSFNLVNTCAGLQLADLNHLFEPFWRRDAARTGDGHVGLGLTLVKACCDSLGISVAATMPSPNNLELSLCFPTTLP